MFVLSDSQGVGLEGWCVLSQKSGFLSNATKLQINDATFPINCEIEITTKKLWFKINQMIDYLPVS